jgi:hypothetical protein
MPNQTNVQKIVYPDGLKWDVSLLEAGPFVDFGVMAAGASFSHNFDKEQAEPGNTAKLAARYKNPTIAIAPSAIWSWNAEAIVIASGGLYNLTSVAGTPVAGENYDIPIGYTYELLYPLPGQNSTGAAPTINSVTQDPDGTPTPLVLNTDYFVAKGSGGWGIYIKDTATADNAFDVRVNYDYTPAASKVIKSGSTSVIASPFVSRFRHYTDDAFTTYDFEFYTSRTELDPGVAFNKKGTNETDVDEIVGAWTAELDTSKSDGEQLFQMILAGDALS